MARVVLEEVSKSYGRVSSDRRDLAVDAIDLEVEDREFLVLVGPSGCGKTSTLRMIAGLESCTSGRITIGDRLVNGVAPKDRDIAMVFQNYALYPHMTVYKNMSFGLELRYGGGWLARLLRRLVQPKKAAELNAQRKQISQRVQDAAATLGIERLLKRKPHQLSGGERQRVALGRAIVREPAAFLFDEPLSNLDARLRIEMRVELRRLHQQLGATMIYVTHDQVEALTLGDRVAVMKSGKLLQVGPPMEVYDSPNDTFVARFIGSPGMNLATGAVIETEQGLEFVFGLDSGDASKSRGSKHGIDLGAGQLEQELEQQLRRRIGKPITLGVRPEDVTLLADYPVDERLDLGCFQGKVVAVDRLGDSAMLYVAFGEAATLRGNAAIGESDAPQEQRQASNQTMVDDRLHPSDEAKRRFASEIATEWVIKTDGRISDYSGQSLEMRLDLQRVHFFDHESGINLLKADRT